MKRFYLHLILSICCLTFGTQIQASHIMGVDMTYRYMGTNGSGQMMYFVRLSFYRDCCTGCLVAGPTPTLLVTDSGCTNTTQTYTMGVDSCPNGCEVVTLCPGAQSTCDNFSSPYPGVEKYEDTVTITLPSQCAKWVISWSDAARNSTISNLQNPSSQSVYIQATLNNMINPATGGPYATNSVYFTRNPVPFACLSNAGSVTYSNGAVAPIGDSVVYALLDPATTNGLPIPYTPGYSTYQPITSSPPCTFDPGTGLLSFMPAQSEVDVITFWVQQYVNGILASSVMRDVQLTIINCSLSAPPDAGTPINLVNADTVAGQVRSCPGTAVSFQIPFTDPGGRSVTLTSDIDSMLPGTTFGQIGTGDSVFAAITWTPALSDTGCHNFEIDVTTDDCPIPGTSLVSYTICVTNSLTVSPHSVIYCGSPVHLSATGGANTAWSPLTGLTFPGSVYTPLAAPGATTLYTFTSSCGSDTALVIYNPPFSMSAGPGGTICQNNFLQLNASLDSLYAPYAIAWIPSAGLTSPADNTPDDTILDPIASPLQTTTYTLQVTASTGCVRTDTTTVTVQGFAPGIRAHATPDTLCLGQQVQLWVTNNPECGLATSPSTGDSTVIQVGTGTDIQGGSGFIYPSPYGNFDKSARHQFLFQASELYALLGSGGQIKSMAMDIGILNSGSQLDNFTIRMGCVPNDSLTGYVDEALLSTVYVANYTPVAGWNNHEFNTPYNWDGISNLVVDVCFNDITNNNINNKMKYSVTPFRSIWYTYTNSTTGACGYSGTPPNPPPAYSTYFERPDFRFNVCVPPLPNNLLTWTPGTGPDSVTQALHDTTYAQPAGNTIYYVTYADTNGCTSSSFVPVYTAACVVYGNTDTACAYYNPLATIDTGLCVPKVYGCTDTASINFDSAANVNNGTCIPKVYGCTDTGAINYNPLANVNNGTCIPKVYGCTDTGAINYDSAANVNNGTCIPKVYGVMDTACHNYNPLANVNIDSCIHLSIMDVTAEITFEVIPNPFSHTTVIVIHSAIPLINGYVRFYDLLGMQVDAVPIPPDSSQVTYTNKKLAAGIYNASLVSGTKVLTTQKIVVE